MYNSLLKSFVKNNALILFGHILIYAQGIILIPIVIKTAGASVYGGYILLLSVIGFIFGISSFGVGFKCRRFLPSAVDIRLRRELFYPQLFFQLTSIIILSFLFIVFFPLFRKLFFKNEIVFSVWLIFPWLFFYTIYSQITDYFRYTVRMGYFNIATIAYPYLHIGIVISMLSIFRGLSVNLLFIAQIFSMVLITPPLIIKVVKEIGFVFHQIKIRQLFDDIKLGFPLVLMYVLDFILGGSDRYIIALYMSVKDVGYYSSAYALGSLVLFLPKVSGVVLPPLLSKATDNNRGQEAQVMLNYTIKVFLLICIPFIVGSYTMSRPILTLFADTEVARNAYLVTPIVALGALFYGFNLILSNMLFVQLKTKVIFKINALAAILNLILNMIFIYIFRNILVAAITTLLSYFVSFIILHVKIKEYFKVGYNFYFILKCLLSSMLMGIILFFLILILRINIATLSLLIIIGIIIYTLSLLKLKAFNTKELSFARDYIASIIKRVYH